MTLVLREVHTQNRLNGTTFYAFVEDGLMAGDLLFPGNSARQSHGCMSVITTRLGLSSR